MLDPNGADLLSGEREGQGDYIFTANTVGEYSFCFENDMSTITHKLIDFDIMVESEPRREAPAKAGQISDKTSALEESIYRLRNQLGSIERTQRQWVYLYLFGYYFSMELTNFRLLVSILARREVSLSSNLPSSTSSCFNLYLNLNQLMSFSSSRIFWYGVLDCVAIIAMAA